MCRRFTGLLISYASAGQLVKRHSLAFAESGGKALFARPYALAPEDVTQDDAALLVLLSGADMAPLSSRVAVGSRSRAAWPRVKRLRAEADGLLPPASVPLHIAVTQLPLAI